KRVFVKGRVSNNSTIRNARVVKVNTQKRRRSSLIVGASDAESGHRQRLGHHRSWSLLDLTTAMSTSYRSGFGQIEILFQELQISVWCRCRRWWIELTVRLVKLLLPLQ